jgi:hypothetical protein
LLPEEVGALVDITICKKSSSEASVVMAMDKLQEVAALRHRVSALPAIYKTVCVSWRGMFTK